MKLSRIALFAILVVSFIPGRAFAQVQFFPNWSVSQFQPNTERGGRTNSVAVHPDGLQMLAASDSGGLFKSIDGGFRWRHIATLPVIFTQAVVYLPATPNVVLVSAKADFKETNGGGVWRSEDGGETWSQVVLPVQNPGSRVSAYGMSALDDDVAVGTSDGLFVSTDGGVNWRWAWPFEGNEGRIFSVLLMPGTPSRIFVGGPAGVRIGTTALGSWVRPNANTAIGGIWSIHAFGASAYSPDHAYVTNGHLLFRTHDRGSNWMHIASAPQGTPPCGGTPFIKTAYRYRFASQFLDLYYGNACGLHRLMAPIFGTPDYSGTWQPLAVGHFPRDLALSGRDPVLLASNGGLHNTADRGLNWAYVGGGMAGYNALQITSVTGQFVGEPRMIDFYYATQDNNVRAMNILRNETGVDQRTPEGALIEAESWVADGAQSRITYAGCESCRPRLAERHLQNARDVLHGHGPAPAPVLIRPRQRIQNAPSGLDVSSDPDLLSWQPFASFSHSQIGVPKLGSAGADSAIVYQAYTEAGRVSLKRIRHSNGMSVVDDLAMDGLESIAINRTNVWYPLYDTDRGNGRHLIAVDNAREPMMVESWTGGALWNPMPGLTALLKEGFNRKLLFMTQLPDAQVRLPLVTAISFNPVKPSSVLVGTVEGGIYYSGDRGKTWGRINGSEGTSYVTSFYWATFNAVYVSTFGRGLWELRNRPIAPPEAFDELCDTCDVLSNDGDPERPPFDDSVLVFDGRILGVRIEDRQLREVIVTPGSSFVFTGNPKDAQDGITITESDGKDTSKYEPLPEHSDGWMVTGLVFMSDDTLTGTVYSESERSLASLDKQ